MATISKDVSEQVLEELGQGALYPVGINNIIFGYSLDENNIPILFSLVQSDSLDPSLYSEINSVFQTWVRRSIKDLQEVISLYYKGELQKTKISGVELSAEEQLRAQRYSEFFCAYLTSARVVEECQRTQGYILEILNLFSFQNIEPFYIPEEVSPGSSPSQPLGQLGKQDYLALLYSKGLDHQQLRSLMPVRDRQNLYSLPYFYVLEELPALAEKTYDEIIFLLQFPNKSQNRNEYGYGYYSSPSNRESEQQLRSVVSLLRSGKIDFVRFRELAESGQKFDSNTLKSIERGVVTVEDLITRKSGKREYSPHQKKLLKGGFGYSSHLVSQLTDEQAFVIFRAATDLRLSIGSVPPKVIHELKKIRLALAQEAMEDELELSYDFPESTKLLACLQKGISGEYFDQPCLSLGSRIETVFLGLEAGLSVDQVIHPNFSLNGSPSHGQTVLQVLSQGKYNFDQLMSFSREKILALADKISEEIIDDKQFHESYIIFLKQGMPWETLKRISLDKLIFLKRKDLLQSMTDRSNANSLFEVLSAIQLQRKLLTFSFPLEAIAELRFTQLSFIYWEHFRFTKTPMTDNVYFNSNFEERSLIALECTDFDIECLCRLNITLQQLRQCPHVGTKHIEAVEEGYPKSAVLACLRVEDIENLRKQGRPKPVGLSGSALRALKETLAAKRRIPKIGNKEVDFVYLPGGQEICEINVPSDGSCLFYSVAFSYLLPIMRDPALFKEHFTKLFGEEIVDSAEENRQRFLKYDGSSHFIREHAEALEVLVNDNFRKRLVAFMKVHEKELAKYLPIITEDFDTRMGLMGDPGRREWGDQLEIEAISRFLGMRITVCQRQGQDIVPKAGADHGEGHPGRIYLVHTTADPKVPSGKNHYHYLMDQRYLSLLKRGGKDEKEFDERERQLPQLVARRPHGLSLHGASIPPLRFSSSKQAQLEQIGQDDIQNNIRSTSSGSLLP